jgi:hypothetical protein
MNTDNHLREVIHKIEKEYGINTIVNEPPLIPMKLDMPILEEAIRKGNNEDKTKTKVRKRASKQSAI